MKSIKYVLIIGIVTFLVASSIGSAGICVKYMNGEQTVIQNYNADLDLEILDVYIDDTRIVAEIKSNEETTVTFCLDFYEKQYPDTDDLTENVRSNQLEIDSGETIIDYYNLPSYKAYAFQSIVTVSNQPDPLNAAGRIFDESNDNFFNWYKFVGWEFDSSQKDIEVNTNLDKNKYGQNQPVGISISVTNNGENDISLTFPTQQSWDFRIYERENQGGNLLYQWSLGKDIAEYPIHMTIEAGETIEFQTIEWDQVNNEGKDIPDDEYYVDAWMLSYYVGGDLYMEIHDFELCTVKLPKVMNGRIQNLFLMLFKNFPNLSYLLSF